MNRRSFFSSLLGSCAAAGTCAVAQSTAVNSYGDRFKVYVKHAITPGRTPELSALPLGEYLYRDPRGQSWNIRWTGWIPHLKQLRYSSQWFARPISDTGVYDASRRMAYAQFSYSPDDAPTLAAERKERGFRLLLKIIDSGSPKQKRYTLA